MPDYIPYYKGEPISLPPLKLFTDFFYPVGCYFETTDTDFDPNVSWGGTWELEDEGLVHISSGENYEVSSNAQDGGEATHTLTVDELASHGHWTYVRVNKGSSGAPANSSISGTSNWWNVQENAAGYANGLVSIGPSGGGQSHNNMQPYKIVNRWHRTA